MNGGVRYTRERLADAAARCADIDEVVALLGTPPYESLRRYLFRRFDHFGIDVSHMPRPQRGTWASARPTTEVLRQVVQAATSIAAALRSLGCDPYNNAARTQFRKWVTADGVDTSHFLGQSSRKGKPGPVPARRPEEILVQHDREQRTTTKLLRRALREVGVADVCARCGVGPEWLGKAMTLEVDHIDGNWRNDRRENLRLLCPNCHAVTPTWCRGGRRSL